MTLLLREARTAGAGRYDGAGKTSWVVDASATGRADVGVGTMMWRLSVGCYVVPVIEELANLQVYETIRKSYF